MRKGGVLLATAVLFLGGMFFMFYSPAFAQDDVDSFDVQVEITGTVEVVQADLIVVSGVTVFPNGAFDPATLTSGDEVVITGLLLDDGTIQASGLALVDTDEDGLADAEDNCPDAANPDQADADGDGLGDLCEEDTPVDTDEDGVVDDEDNCPDVANPGQVDDDGDGVGNACDENEGENDEAACGGANPHPVATTLAEEFDLDYETIMAWHCDGFGFGEIARALLIAEQSEGTTPDEILEMKKGGAGWGDIKKEYDVDPGDLAPGRVIAGDKKDKKDKGDDAETPDEEAGDSGDEDGQPGQNGNNGNNGNPPGQDKDKGKDKDHPQGDPPGQDKDNGGKGGKK